ncbi:hypothetical protein C0Q44_16040 [Paenibacillus sp. PCH8]|uniref:hypothetical protein n=1 Tax=Paenibacillus sp. PCH8 TaxID=2066524 RepID=UPI000CF994A9|nr:hypothetical protein [Paenibacillus sp. PCH8]PQP82881.1 hypothetical protein C0Q44_16040 [Paenibacillus sp. PCH8]
MLTLSSNSTQPGIDQTPSSQTNSSGFHMTTDEFKNRFNDAVGKYRLNGLSITRLNVKESSESEQSNGTFEYVFSDELRVVGVLNEDKNVQEVRLYATGDASKPAGGTFLTAIATLILTTNSEYTYNDAQDVIQDIGLLDRDVNQRDFDRATIRNGLEYRFSIQDQDQDQDQDHSIFEITVAK